MPYPCAFFLARGWELPQLAAKVPGQPDHPQPHPCPTLAPSYRREGGNHLSSQQKIPGSQTIHNRIRVPSSRLFTVARVGTTAVRSERSRAARSSTTASVPHPRAFFPSRGWETTSARSKRSRAARPPTTASVSYSRAFFLARGWEPPQLAAKDPGQPDHPQPRPCPTLATFFRREGGNHLSSQQKIPGSQTIHNCVRALPSRLLSGARVG